MEFDLPVLASTACRRRPPDKQNMPTVMNFSFGVQREVGFHTVVDAAYVGALGRHIIYERNKCPP